MLEDLYFKIAIYEKFGIEFQNFFALLYSEYNDKFQPVNGTYEDDGNDGYIPSEGHYFQVYAPSSLDVDGKITLKSINYATNKLEQDFLKVSKNWPNIKYFTFIMNDRFLGQPSKIGQKLSEMKEKFINTQFDYYGAQNLRKIFRDLNEKVKKEIIGFPIVDYTNIKCFDIESLGKVIDYIMEIKAKCNKLFGINNSLAPDFEKKLQFNRLCQEFQYELKCNSYQIYMVDEFLKNNLNCTVQIQSFLQDLYKKYNDKIPNNEENKSDIIYICICQSIIPEEFKFEASSYIGYMCAAKILVAKYFEACDVFEDPDNSKYIR